jgi:CheY-like chemotaxis protein
MEGTPRALVVEDSPVHRFLAETLLSEAGFRTTCTASLLQGLDTALAWLAPTQPPVPTVILLDLMLPHERCPIMEGTALAAHLTESMEAQLPKPLTADAAASLRRLVDRPPILPAERDRDTSLDQQAERRLARQIQRSDAARLLHFVRSDAAYASLVPVPEPLVWTRAVVRSLLLEPACLLGDEPWLSWARAQGGFEVVQARLRQVALPHDLRPLLETVLTNGTNWRTSLDQLNVSKTTYYRRLDALCDHLAVALMTWR